MLCLVALGAMSLYSGFSGSSDQAVRSEAIIGSSIDANSTWVQGIPFGSLPFSGQPPLVLAADDAEQEADDADKDKADETTEPGVERVWSVIQWG
jgi:hypothetical protein